MAIGDKVLCLRCRHPKHKHTGNHVKGTRTACRSQVELHPNDHSNREMIVCDCHEMVDIEVGMEIQGVYDGVLFWIGTDGYAYHRFYGRDTMTLRMRERALPYINKYNRRVDGTESDS